jgi:hypothetical protein
MKLCVSHFLGAAGGFSTQPYLGGVNQSQRQRDQTVSVQDKFLNMAEGCENVGVAIRALATAAG